MWSEPLNVFDPMEETIHYNVLSKLVHELSESEILKMCADILNWQRTGILDKKCFLLEWAEKEKVSNIRTLEDIILEESMKRYENVALLLFKKYARRFLR